MRLYFGSTAQELDSFINEGSLSIPELYAATPHFAKTHSESDEEELEFTLSLLAAEDAQEFSEEDSSQALVIACEVPDEEIDTVEELTVTLVRDLKWSHVEAVFTVGDELDDLTWYAPQEVSIHLASWM